MGDEGRKGDRRVGDRAGSRPRVVIVGAGFGGLQAARSLEGEPVEVVLVDRNNYHGFWPLLYQVSLGQIEAGQVAYPIRSALRGAENIRFRMMDVERVDTERKVVLGDGDELRYDYLILGPGSQASYLGIEGAEAHTLPFKSLDHGLAIRNRILHRFEQAVALEPGPERRALLTFVMVGAGPTGVELAGALGELVRSTLAQDYPTLRPDEVRVVLLEAMERALPAFGPKVGRYAARRLRHLGVEVRLEAQVESVDHGRIRLSGGEEIEAGTIIWTAGVQGHPLAEASGLPTTRKGTVPVDEFLTADDDASVYVVGDLAHFEDGDDPLPMVAQVAIQQGRRAAGNILRDRAGRPLKPFSYTDLGIMAVVGRGRAVMEWKGVSLRGALAWPAWALIHLAKLIGFRNRLLVMVNWAAAYLFGEPGVRLILPLGRPAAEAASAEEEEEEEEGQERPRG